MFLLTFKLILLLYVAITNSIIFINPKYIYPEEETFTVQSQPKTSKNWGGFLDKLQNLNKAPVVNKNKFTQYPSFWDKEYNSNFRNKLHSKEVFGPEAPIQYINEEESNRKNTAQNSKCSRSSTAQSDKTCVPLKNDIAVLFDENSLNIVYETESLRVFSSESVQATSTSEDITICESESTKCQTESTKCQTDSTKCQTDSTPCQTDSTSCETDSTCQTDSTTYQTDSPSCQTDSKTCQTESSACQTDSTTCQTDSTTCQTDSTAHQTDLTTCKTASTTRETTNCIKTSSTCETSDVTTLVLNQKEQISTMSIFGSSEQRAGSSSDSNLTQQDYAKPLEDSYPELNNQLCSTIKQNSSPVFYKLTCKTSKTSKKSNKKKHKHLNNSKAHLTTPTIINNVYSQVTKEAIIKVEFQVKCDHPEAKEHVIPKISPFKSPFNLYNVYDNVLYAQTPQLSYTSYTNSFDKQIYQSTSYNNVYNQFMLTQKGFEQKSLTSPLTRQALGMPNLHMPLKKITLQEDSCKCKKVYYSESIPINNGDKSINRNSINNINIDLGNNENKNKIKNKFPHPLLPQDIEYGTPPLSPSLLKNNSVVQSRTLTGFQMPLFLCQIKSAINTPKTQTMPKTVHYPLPMISRTKKSKSKTPKSTTPKSTTTKCTKQTSTKKCIQTKKPLFPLKKFFSLPYINIQFQLGGNKSENVSPTTTSIPNDMGKSCKLPVDVVEAGYEEEEKHEEETETKRVKENETLETSLYSTEGMKNCTNTQEINENSDKPIVKCSQQLEFVIKVE